MTKYKTKNSFTQKPSPAQIVAYLLFLMKFLFFFIIIQRRYFSFEKRVAMIVVLTILFACQVVITLVTSFIDPSDDFMIKYRNNRDSVTHQQTLDMLYCEICHSYVSLTSRHCRTCSRCVQDFDHHCMWINNCIGKKNYKYFVIMIVVTFSVMVVYVISAAMLWAQHLYAEFIVQMGFVWASGILIVIFAILILNLIGLHVYLNYLGLTTYQFIMNSRQKQKKTKKQELTQQNIQITKVQQQKFSFKKNSKQQLNNTDKKSLDLESINKTGEVINSAAKNQQNQYNLQKLTFHFNETFNSETKLGKVLPIKGPDDQNLSAIMQEIDQKSDKQSVKISQFFTRNKSLKILVNSDAIKPQKLQKDIYPKSCTNSIEKLKKGPIPKDLNSK